MLVVAATAVVSELAGLTGLVTATVAVLLVGVNLSAESEAVVAPLVFAELMLLTVPWQLLEASLPLGTGLSTVSSVGIMI